MQLPLMRYLIFHFLHFCLCDNVIDVDDFLNPEYMPSMILMLESPYTNETKKYTNISSVNKFDGGLDDAIHTMGYHRYMMNEYLCRNYVANQIVRDMTISRVKKRMGAVSHGPGMNTFQTGNVQTKTVHAELLNDEGSSNYKDWLSKSTTLEDIYRHYDMDKRSDVSDGIADKEEKDEDEEYDGQIAGYGYTHKLKSNHAPSKLGHSGDGIYISGVGGYSPSGGGGYSHSGGGGYSHSGGGGYPHSGSGSLSYGGPSFGGHSGGGSYGGGHPVIHEQVIHLPKHHHHHIKYVDKKESLTELFEIALTALAFLSFGMFIVHVIMCISMTTNTTTTAMGMMMPTNTGNLDMTGMGIDSNGGGGDMTDMGGDMMGNGDGMGTDNMGNDDMNTGENGGVDGGGGNGEDGDNNGVGNDTGDTNNTGNGEGEGLDNGGGEMTGEGGDTAMDDSGGSNMPVEGDMGEDAVSGGGADDEVEDAGDEPAMFVEIGEGSFMNKKKIKDLFYLKGPLRSNIVRGIRVDNNLAAKRSMILSEQGSNEVDYLTAALTATGTGGGGATFEEDATIDEELETDNSRIQEEDEDISIEIEETAEVPMSPAFVNHGDHDKYQHMQYRNRRDISTPTVVNPNNYALNDLARRILISIEAAAIANRDEGVCLRKTLCENNRYSRQFEDSNKMWIPIWSLGMSWLTSRLGINAPPSTLMLDSLKASILGLGKAKCEIIYQSCELQRRKLELKEELKEKKAND